MPFDLQKAILPLAYHGQHRGRRGLFYALGHAKSMDGKDKEEEKKEMLLGKKDKKVSEFSTYKTEVQSFSTVG